MPSNGSETSWPAIDNERSAPAGDVRTDGLAKDGDAIARYYHPDFVMYSDGMSQNFAEYEASHRGLYETPITYSIEYDDETWVETEDRVAARVFITTSLPGGAPNRIEVVLIATYVDGRIHRVWETTWPSWRTVEGFEAY